MQKITIAIDGFSSTGKSTIAKQIAKHLEYVYVDSGAMYRAMTLFAMNNCFIDDSHFNIKSLVSRLEDVEINFIFNTELGFAEVYLNGVNVENEIRTLDVSRFVSKVSTIQEVRHQLVKQQQLMGKNKAVVMDGRDIGTVVFPDAELKIFMTASTETRARRRFDELIQRGDNISYDAVLQNVKERDYIDSHRKESPLIKASDANEIDNSNLNLDEQFHKVLHLVELTLDKIE